MKRLREWLESIVFAGLKPSGGSANQTAPSAPHPPSRIDGLKARIDKLISGGPAPSDPLYLSNRTLGQKIRTWAVVGVPIVILIAAIGVALSQREWPLEKAPRPIPPRELAAKMLPNIKDIKIESNRSLEVMEARIEHSATPRMAGVVRNLTDRDIAAADIFCDVTDATGSLLGGVMAHVEHIPPQGTKKFEIPLKQADARAVLVREITTK